MLYGTIQKRAAIDCRTWWVVSRRSLERIMPPCSAMLRNRLSTRHTVIHGTSQRNRYSSGRPNAVKPRSSTAWAARMRNPTGRALRDLTARNSGSRFFQPEMPTASRTSFRRNESGETG